MLWDGMDVENALKAYGTINKEEWERTRAIAYTTALPHLKKGTTMTEFWELPGDKEGTNSTITLPTEQEINKLTQKYSGV
jgi:hypothetical protein